MAPSVWAKPDADTPPAIDPALLAGLAGVTAKMPPVFAPPRPDAAPAIGPDVAQGLGGGNAMPPVFQSTAPQVRMPTPVERATTEQGNRLEKLVAKDQNPWGTPQNHPGILGKIGHALNVATGGVNRRAADESDLIKQLNTESLAEQQKALSESQVGHNRAETGLEEAQTADLSPDKQREKMNAQLAEHGLQIGKDGAITPVSEENLSPALRAQMAGSTPDLATYRSLIGLGMSPADALKEIEKDKALALAPKNMEAKTLQLPNGEPVAGKTDAQGNLLLADGSPAPAGSKLYQQPNYGMLVLPTKTQTITDPESGLPTVMGWNEKTQRYDIPQGTAGSGTYAHQIQSAGAMTRMLYSNLYPLVDKMTKAGEFGPIQGRFEDFLNRDVGNAPPDVAQFHQLMNGVVSMMMGMYGFRRQSAVDQLTAQMGARMTPESVLAALKGMEQHADSVIGGAVDVEGGNNGRGAGGGAGKEPARPANVPAGYHFDAKGAKGPGWYK